MAREKNKRIKKTQQALEKRLMMDAASIFAAVEAIPSAVFHLDAQDIDGDDDTSAGDQPTDGATVSNWTDGEAGSGDNSADISTSGSANGSPVYDDDAFGTGRGGLRFDGGDEMEIDNETGINNGGSNPEKSFAFTFRTATDINSFQIVYEQGGGTRGYQVAIADGNLYVSGYNNTGSEWGADRFKVMNHGTIQTNTTYNVIMVFDSTDGPNGTIKSNVNGGDFITLQSVGAQPNHTNDIGIGGNNQNSLDPRTLTFPGDGQNFDGWIGEIWQWNHALTDQEVSDLETYQALKWTNRPSLEFNEGATVLEGGSVTITNTQLNALDNDTPNTSLTYQLTSQENGNLRLSGTNLSLGDIFTQDDIDNNRISFLHNDSETTSASFDFRLTDGGTLVTDTFDITVTPVDDPGDDAPVVSTNNQGFVQAGGTATITQALLETTDSDTVAASLTYSVTATVDGSIFNTNLGMTVTSFTQADINNGFIRFDHDGTIAIPASFDFDVTDGTTIISDTFTLDVDIVDTAANDPPVIRINTGDTMAASAEINILTTNLQVVDPDNAINELTYTITSLDSGNVLRGGTSLSVGQTFTQADIDFGIISFLHDGSAGATAGFGFDVTDANSTISGTYDITVVSNTAPTISPLGPFSIAEDSANGLLIGTASGFDADGDGFVYSIASGNGDSIFQINPINGQLTIADNTNLNFEATSSYSLVIRVTDDGPGNLFAETTVIINITDVNDAPVLPASGPFSIGEFAADNDAVGTIAGTDEDLPADTITYSIVGGTGSALFDIDNSGNITVDGNGNFDFEVGPNSYTLDIRANDGTVDSNTITVTINITDENDAPVLPASGPFSIGENAADTDAVGTINAATDVDVPADTITYSITGGTGSALFNIDNSGNITVNGNGNFDFESGTTSYTIDVVANDGTDNSNTETITINITEENDAPVLPASGPFSIGENAADTDAVGTINAATDQDVPADTITYSITGGTGAALFNIDNSGNITVNGNGNFDFETTTSYTIDIVANDGTIDSNTETITINITDENDAPVLPASGPFSIGEFAGDTDAVGTVTATDADVPADTITYSITGGTGAALFNIDNSGNITVNGNGNFDFESGTTSYTIDVVANDGTIDSNTETITINITDENDTPVLPASGPFSIGENAADTDAVGTINAATDVDVPADTITYSITGGTGAALFNIDNSGNITVNGNGNFDFESGTTSYTIDVVANDGTIDSNTETITINITDENDAPVLPASGPFSIGENAADTDAVGTVNAATDVDVPADTITYSITGGTGAALFNIDNSGNITVNGNGNFDFESGTTSYTIDVVANDGTDNSNTETITINITDENDAPVLPASGPFSIGEDAADTDAVGTVTATDADVPADTITYSITGGTGAALFNIDNSGNITVNGNGNFDFESGTTSYTIDVVANDGTIDSNTETITINITNVNEAPVLPASGPFSIGENAADTDAVGTINAATDPDIPADTITYSITGGTGAALFNIDNSGNITVNGNGNFDFESGTTSYTIDVVANDGTIDSNTETITINITDENDAPVLPASGPFSIGEFAADTDAVGTINAATDVDVPADTITYSITGGTGAALFNIDNSGNITVNGNGNFDFESGTTSYTIDVVANDGTDNSNTETITINITDENDAPVMPASGPFSIGEDAADTDAVGTVTATDADVPADTITYSITGGTGSALFNIDNSGNITVNGNGNFDFESGTTSYTIDVIANDGTIDSNTETITINITNVNEAPSLTASGPFSIPEDSGDTDAVGTINAATDPDIPADTITYSITGGTGAALFNIDNSGNITVNGNGNFDFDTTTSYTIDIVANDGTVDSNTITVTINITDSNVAPILPASGPFSIGEFAGDTDAVGTINPATDSDIPADTITYAIVGGTGAALFNIDNSGNITVNGNGNFDFESGTTSYTIDIVANDGTIDSNTETITINITDENDAPVLPASGPFSIGENAADTDAVGTVTATDVDVPADTITYSITGGTGAALFNIDNSGNITVNGNGNFDFESGTTSYTIDVVANDGTIDSNTETITINITDENDAPVLPASGPFSIGENAADTAAVGTVNPATDVDVPADTITYSITGGTGAALFNIDNSGNITVNGNGNFDFESGTTSYTIDIVANDGTDNSNTETITINITDENDAPVLPASGPFSIGEFAADTDAVGTINAATDADVPADTITYSITGGTGAALFNIDNSGNITVNGNGNFDFESGTTSYTIDVVANDGTIDSNTETITINITDENDAPVLPASGPFSIGEFAADTDAVGTVTATDADVPADTITYSITGGTGAALFNIDNSGNITVNGNGNFDFESGTTSYTIDVVANDGTIDSNTETITINITDENDAPVLPASGPFSIGEFAADTDAVGTINAATDQDVPADTITYSITGGTGAALFNIDNSGNITVNGNGNFDFESGTTSYTIDVVANDGTDNSNTETITINITDENDAPVLPASGPFSIPEDAADTDAVGTINAATDQDVPADTITYSITGGTGSALFNIDNSGNITVNGNGNFDFEITNSYTIDIVANDGTIDSNTITITIDITNVNDAPVLPASGPFSIGESAADTDAVGTINPATDSDVPADTITYSITGGTGAALFNIDNAGNITVNGNGNFDFESGTTSYTIDVVANDGTIDSNTETITINITDENDAPVLPASGPFSIGEFAADTDAVGTINAATDSDVPADTITYSITGGTGAALFNIDNSGNITVNGNGNFDFESGTTSYTIDVVANDGTIDSNTETITINIIDENDAPVLPASGPFSIGEFAADTDAVGTINAATDVDVPADTITYSITGGTGAALFNIDNSGNITVNGNGNFDFESGTTSYTIDVVANDGTIDSNTETITINITDENDAPVLPASGPFSIGENAADTNAVGTINAATDVDVPADTITYSITGGTGSALFNIDNAGNITVNGNGNFDFESGTTSYTIDVVANDGTDNSNTETITINITDENDAPVLPASGPFSIPEDSADTDAVGTINAATDQDVPADTITYSITGGTGAALFNIDNAGNITVNGNGNFDFESGTTSYTIDVVANDGTIDSNTETITIDITNVNDAPILPASGPFSIGENAADTDAVGTVTATDADVPADTITYSITGGTGAALFNIDNSGNITVNGNGNFDFESGTTSYTIDVIANDGTINSNTETITINITDENDAPVLPASGPFSIGENAADTDAVGTINAATDQDVPADTITYSISGGTGAALFNIDNAGNITVNGNGNFDFEGGTTSYTIDVIANDGTIDSNTETITINITDENDAPVLPASGPFSIPEDAADTDAVGTINAATDQDVPADTITYSITGGTGAALFNIDNSGNITVNGNGNFDFESGTTSYTIDVVANDGTIDSNTETITIDITNVNDAPILPASGPFSIGENAADTDAVGTINAATDADVPADTITYSITGGTGAALFSIDNNGNITVNGNGNFDFESGTTSYTIDVVANDGTIDSNTETITINITDENDAPVLPASGPFSIGENAADTDAVGLINVATDQDVPADTITYSITGGTGAALFNIDNSGNITVNGNGNFDFETTTSYTIDVVANDGTIDSNTETITINITDENDAPVLPASGPFSIPEDAADTDAVGTINAATDQDVPADTITYSITGGTGAGLFNIDNSGNITVNGNGNFDFESGTTSYTLDVVANDGTIDSNTETITIDITNVNDAPILPASGPFSIGENAADTDAVGTINAATDSDIPADTITYNITGGSGAGLFLIDNSGNITVNGNGNFDFESGTTSYTLDIVANDGTIDSNTETITINITDENDAPVLPASGPFSIGEFAADTDAVGTINVATDQDIPADTITYSITGGTGAALFNIDNAGNITVNGNGNFDFESGTTSYTIDVVANDGTIDSNTETITINITDENDAPILPASGPFSIGEFAGDTDAVGTINAATDVDVPADTITYSITGGTGAALFNIDNSGNITVNGNGNFDFESGTTSYTIDVVANDGTIDSNTETITINITDENDAPVLPASGPFSIGENAADTDAVATINPATDADVPADTITYSITGGTGAALFNIDNSGNITVNGNGNFDFESGTTSYTIDVVANDGTDNSNTETITINITDENDAPVLPASGPFSIPEDAADTDAVGTINVATDQDVPADTITYSITGGTGAALFNIDNAGNITVNGNGNFDFESGTTSYTIDVVANDGTIDSNTETITIDITNVNDAPILPASGPFSIGENAADTDAVATINPATDSDIPADTITYSITGGTGAGLFLIDNSGNITVNGNGNFDFESGTTSYTIDVVANDGTIDSNTETITINITDENDAPVLPASGPFSIPEDAADTNAVGTINAATDQDVPADTITYSITGGTGAALFNIDNAGNITVNGNGNFDFETTTSYTIDVVANDGTIDSNTETITINITDVNDAPILPASGPFNIGENAGDTDAVGTINVATDQDVPADTITYSITGGTGAALFNIDNAGNITVNGNGNFDFESGTTSYTIDVVANDGTIDSNTETITINITDENDAPVLPASGPFSIGENAADTDAVGLINVATDADVPADTITYSITGGTGAALFNIDNAGNITVNGNGNFDFESGTTSYTIDVVANDGTDNSNTETITINILDENDAPVLPASGPFSIPEDSADTDAVGTINAATDQDVPADTITYSITGGTGAGLFLIDNAGNITVNGNGNFDFESGTTSYTIDVVANDGTIDSNTETITIDITNVNDAPILPASGPFSIGENAADTDAVATINPATDADVPADTITYSITGGTGAALFNIDNSGNITVNGNGNFDFESGTTSYTIDIVANDGTIDSNTETITINITDENDAPVLPASGPFSIGENAADTDAVGTINAATDQDVPADTITYSITGGTGAGLFLIDNAGNITVNGNGNFDFESGTTSYTIDVVANDGTIDSNTETITINITDENDAPVLPASGPFSIPEDAADTDAVGTINAATDQDVPADTITYSITGGTGAGLFNIDNAGNITVNGNGNFDFESGTTSYTIDVVANDGTIDSNTETITIDITNVNDAPILPASGPFSIGENATDTDAVGTINAATDADVPADTITYSIVGGTGAALFNIDNAGNITVNGNGNFDFESGTTSYTIDVVANDGTIDSNTETITINILDENDAPILPASGPFSIGEFAGDTDAVGTINAATDQDVPADTITYSIVGGTGAALFNIDNAGNITVNGNGNFDFETTTSYTIDVVANDGTIDSNTETITINITDENDAPVLSASGPFSIGEFAADTDAVGTVNAATDQDVPADTITYSITGGTGAALFNIDNAGNITVNGNGNFDFESGTTSYTIDVVANDGTIDSNTETITINILDENDAPVLPASGPFSIGENLGDTGAVGTLNPATDVDVPADTITYSITGGTGAALFNIDNTGNITVNGDGNFDFESGTTSYTIDVVANDGTDNSNTETITINITDENDAPVLPASGPFSIPEDSADTDAVGTINVATDQDVPADTITYSITGGTGAGLFLIDNAGNITVNGNGNFDFESGTTSYTIDVVANDGTIDSNTETITIDITNVNDAPILPASGPFSIGESAGDTDAVGTVNAATDQDVPADTITYSITGGTGAALFNIDNAGNITVNGNGNFDFESGTTSYTIDVVANDGTIDSNTETITINILDENDAPVLPASGPFSIPEDAADTSAVGTINAATDQDVPADTITYSIIGGTGAGLFNIDNAGNITVNGNGNFDFETTTSYTLDVVANDGTIDSNTETITVNITDVNDAPILPASGPFDIGEFAGDTDPVGTINVATDQDLPADTITYSITGGTGAALFNIDNAGNITVNGNGNFDFESGTTSYTIDVVANDGTIDSNTETITINILDENDAPVLPTSGPFDIGENSGDTDAVGTINPATDVDVPADTITYSITGGTGAALFNIDNAGNITVNGNGNFDFESGTTSYTIDVLANDGTDNSNTETITINILDENDAPVLPASGPFSVGENAVDTNAVGTINPATDSDVPADTITYSIVGGTGAALFNIDNSGNITVNGNGNFDFEGGTTSYTIDIVANDGFNDSNTETITINITDENDAPILPASGPFDIGEFAADTDPVGTINAATDQDIPADTITYSITGGTGAALFNIDNAGNITVNGNGNFDFEVGPNTYTIDVVANDGTIDSNTETITINILDENDAPVLPPSGPFSIGENLGDTGAVGTINPATDVDVPANTITYSITGGTGAAFFNIDNAGNITVNGDGNFDFESGTTSYTIDVIANDGTDNSNTETITINILDENDAPILPASGPFAIGENAVDTDAVGTINAATDQDVPADTITYSITGGTGAGLFNIDNAGNITVNGNGNFDFESGTTSYTIDVVANDGTIDSNTETITINILDENDAPILPASGPFDIGEFAGDTDAVGTINAATDQDVPADTITYSIVGGTGAAFFNIDNAGNITVNGNGNFDFEVGPNTYTIDVVANDGTIDSNTETITINILDENDPPVLPPSGPFSIGEFAGNTDPVGTINPATDVDVPANTITYSIVGGTGAALFNIDNSGNITVNGNGNFDFEVGPNTYTIDVIANDGTDNSNTETITINITDQNDAPTLVTSNPAPILEGGNTLIDATILNGNDEDAADGPADITYNVTSTLNGQLERVGNPGVAITSFTQDDVNNNQIIFVHDGTETLAAGFDVDLTDGNEDGAGDASGSVSMVIIPVNDPAVISTNVEPPLPVGTSITLDNTILEATDPDDPDSDLVFTVNNITNGTLTINGAVAVNGSTFTEADIDNGLVVFTHDGSLTLNSTFDVSLDDDPLDGNPPDLATVSFDILHPPSLDVNTGTTILEDTPDNPSINTITNAMLSASDFDTPLANLTYNITSAPVNGQLELTTAPGVAITSFTQDDIDNGRVVYAHGDGEDIFDSFDFEVTDGFFTLPVDTFDITITPQNDKAQITTNVPPSIVVGGNVTFDPTLLQGTDPDDSDADITFTVSNIQNGTLTINGVPAVNGSTFTQEDVNNGLIEFTHDGTMTVTGSFDVVLADGLEDFATVDTGTVVVNIEFIPVIDVNVGTTVLEGTIFAPSDNNIITTAMLSVSDFDTPDPDIIFNIVDATDNGQIELSTNPGVAVTSFTQDDLANNRVIYAHDGSETIADAFVFEVTDGFYTLPVETFDITIIPQNDPPELILLENTSFIENTPIGRIITPWSVVDPDGPSATLSFVGSPSIFGLNSSGIFVTELTDYEVDPHSYTITLRAFDGQYSIDQVFTLNLGDMNETPPVIAPDTQGVQPLEAIPGTLDNSRPISDTINQSTNGDFSTMGANQVLDAVGFNGQDQLGFAFYGTEIEEVIKGTIVEEISELIETSDELIDVRDGLQQLDDLPASDADLIMDTDEDVDILQDEEFKDNRLLQALLNIESDTDVETESESDEDADGIFVKSTDIQLNDSAIYYKNKVSRLEEALLSDRSEQ